MSVLADKEQWDSNTFERTIVMAGDKNESVVVIDADLARATQTDKFKAKYPDRYFDIGIAEQNLIGVAAGFAWSGKIPFVGTFATFITKRCLDQINISIAYPKSNVKMVGIEPGLSSGRNGATHQAVDDIAIMRAIPNMIVVDPADSTEIMKVVEKSVDYIGPVYIRMPRGRIPVLFDPDEYSFEFGRGVRLFSGRDVTIISCGIMTEKAIDAVSILKKEGVHAGLLHMPTIKPIDKEAVIEAAAESHAIVTAENHSVIGGLGGAVAEVLAASCPAPVEFVGIDDCFGETGSEAYLMGKYCLTTEEILSAAKKAMKRKGE